MTSGIYKLTFSNGSFYIGKSIDIENRWKQHFDKFQKGIAAKNMQWAFDNYGYPDTKILMEVHQDHIDLMEGWAINLFKHGDMLNSAGVTAPSEEDVEVMDALNINGMNFLQLSTADHARAVRQLAKDLLQCKDGVEELKSGDYSKIEQEKNYWIKRTIEKQTEIDRLKDRNIFERIFNT